MKTILILLKKSSEYGGYDNYGNGKSKAGLYNSARLISETLDNLPGVKTKLELCIDGNDIDNKLFKYKPDICIIEAIWVTPTKMIELQHLHPNVKFIIRIHSKIPFLAMEGVAIKWILEYIEIPNIRVAFNNKKTSHDLNSIGINNIYLPNIYEKIDHKYGFFNELFDKMFTNSEKKSEYNIGCFGAIRPLKNQLNQAIAAIKFGDKNNAIINFYINSGRLEQSGENVLKNIRALFENSKHNLIETDWLERDDFLYLLSDMDISMQVSLTETFNIVAADSVMVEIPIVISKEIDWLNNGIADPNDVDSMVEQLNKVWKYKDLYVRQNLISLKKYNKKSLIEWKNFLKLHGQTHGVCIPDIDNDVWNVLEN